MTRKYNYLRKYIKPYFYIIPVFIFYGIFTLFPILKTLYLSFTDSAIYNLETNFIGFKNYIELFHLALFYKILLNTIIFSVGTIIPALILGLFFALLLHETTFFKGVYRAAIFYPTMLPLAGVSMVWMFILTPGYGLLNYYLTSLGLPDIDWLHGENTALLAIMGVQIWKFFGYYMIIFTAGLQNIPRDLFEEASLEGCNYFQKFRYITFPLLTPTSFFAGIIAVINSFQCIDQIYVMTKGGPRNATNLLIYYIYQTGFQWWETGVASTLSTILLIVILMLTTAYFYILQRQVHYT